MLQLIAQALMDYERNGIAVIKTTAEHDSTEIAEYVEQTLKGLKCSYKRGDDEIGTVFLDLM